MDKMSTDQRSEVRNCAVQSLYKTLCTHGKKTEREREREKKRKRERERIDEKT